MAVAEIKWREDILNTAQKRFKRYVIDETLEDLAQVEKRFVQAAEIAKKKTDELGVKAATAALDEVQQLQEKVKTLDSVADSNFRMQLGGIAGLDVVSSSSVTLKK